MATYVTNFRVVRDAILTLCLSTVIAGCGKGKTKTADQPTSDGTSAAPRGANDAASPPNVDGGAASTADDQSGLDRKGAPPNAVAVVGAPRFSGGEAIDHVVTSRSGLLVTCGNRYVRLWDPSGRLVWSVVATQGRAACGVSPDGKFVAWTEGDLATTVHVVDWKAGTDVTSTNNSGNRVVGFAFSPDGQRVVVLDGRLAIRSATAADVTASTPDLATVAGFSADGTVVAVGGDKVLTWAGDNKRATLAATLPKRATAAMVSEDGGHVGWVATDAFGVVDVKAGSVTPLAMELGDKPKQVALSPDGGQVAFGTKSGVSVWETATGKKLWDAKTKDTPALAFSADGKTLYYSDLRRLVAADAATGTTASMAAPAAFVAWADDGAAVLKDASHTWGVAPATGASAPSAAAPPPPAGAPAWTDEVAKASDGTVVGAASESLAACAPLKIWVSGGGEQTLAKPSNCDSNSSDAAWVIGAGTVVAINSDKPEVWDVVAKKKLFAIDRGPRPVIAAAVAPNRSRLVVVLGPAAQVDPGEGPPGDEEYLSGTRLEVYSMPDGSRVGAVQLDKTGVANVAAAPDGATAVVAWADGQIDLLKLSTAAEPRTLGRHPSRVQDIEYSPKGDLAAVTDDDHQTIFWSVSP
jgi:WD40 repeat protein